MRRLKEKLRFTVGDASDLTGLHINTIRRLADRDMIPCNRDWNNRRIFTADGIKKLRDLAGIGSVTK